MHIFKKLNFFRPAPHIDKIPDKKVEATYKMLRWKVFIGIIIGYTGYYLVRNNFSLAMPYLKQEGYSNMQLSWVLAALPLTYGCSKFLMALISDRSNPRYFMACGLFISAFLNFFYSTGFVLRSITMMMTLMFLNGLVQGMGWPAAARAMVHWFSKDERGTKMSIMATTQSLGGSIIGPLTTLGIAIFGTWHSIFYFPAMFSLLAAVVILLLVRDMPQTQGLPSIEEYHNKYVKQTKCGDLPENKDDEKKIPIKEIIFKHILQNKYLLFLTIANLFVYFIRYGMISWIPTYLTEVKDFTHEESRWALSMFEGAAIPGMILCGWISDKLFCGRRAPICIIYMTIVLVAIVCYWLSPVKNYLLTSISLGLLGFSLYGPVALITIFAIDLVPKNAAGTASGLTGLSGYVGGSLIASIGIGFLSDNYGWDHVFMALLAAGVLAIFFLYLTLSRTQTEKETC